MRSPANRRTRSSSAERKKRDSPGSPWRPERPRSWLSMRRDSWRSVPMMNRPPASTTFSRPSCDARLDARQDLGEALVVVGVAGAQAELGQLEVGEVLGVAAELDVDAAAGHVGGDGDRAGLAGLGDDLALALGVLGLGVEHRVRDALALELLGEQLGDLDGDGADEDRLAVLVALLDLLGDRVPLAVLGLVDLVVAVRADHRAVRRDLHDAELVDLHELGRLGEGGAGHARELVVQAEVVLQRDRSRASGSPPGRARPPWPRRPGAGPPTSAGPRGCAR